MNDFMSETFRVSGEQRTAPLRTCVRDALDRYFEGLDGHETRDLYQMVLAEVEEPMLEAVMAHCGRNQTRAARILGMSRSTLRKKLNLYGI